MLELVDVGARRLPAYLEAAPDSLLDSLGWLGLALEQPPLAQVSRFEPWREPIGQETV
jgi:hypothetical protein